MNEAPKSIWRKPLRLPQLLLVWLGLMAATTIIFTAIMFVLNAPFELYWLAIIGTVSATVLLAGWIFIRWLCCWRNLKRSLFALACCATLIALFYAEENWRGKREWENYKREWEAKGEKFDFKDFIPPPVPDAQNVAMTPVVASCYDYILTRDGRRIPNDRRDTNWVNHLAFDLGDAALKTNGLGYWAKSTASDLKCYQENFRALAAETNLFAVPPQPQSPAADVLLALGKYDATVEELRQAARRPYCRFPLNYDSENPAEILLPPLAAMKSCTQLLRLRALAELQAGQSDKALADVQLSLRLTEGIRTEPFLISQLVRLAMTEIILQPVYEGLANRQWTDAQLSALDAELAKLDFLTDFKFSMRSERAWSSGIIDFVSQKQRFKKYQELMQMELDREPEDTSTAGQLKKISAAIGFSLMPAGWFEQNKLAIAKIHEHWLLRIADPERHQILPEISKEAFPLLANWKSGPRDFFVKLLLPGVISSSRKNAREQISVDLARTAIALERHRLARGEFPESLDALAPQFIAQVPHDVIGGQPLKYRRDADGKNFILYSVGWNETDDGGVTYIPPGGTQPRFDEGDWVWRYPKN
jgi:hypothetical protein